MMNRLLVPTDGSKNAERALQFALELAKAVPGMRIELLNVQPAVRGSVSMFVAKPELDAYRREEGQKALAAALETLAASGVPYDHHIGVGAPGATIAAFAEQLGCSQIVMGTRGHSGALGTLLGSVATEVIREANVPVTVVK